MWGEKGNDTKNDISSILIKLWADIYIVDWYLNLFVFAVS